MTRLIARSKATAPVSGCDQALPAECGGYTGDLPLSEGQRVEDTTGDVGNSGFTLEEGSGVHGAPPACPENTWSERSSSNSEREIEFMTEGEFGTEYAAKDVIPTFMISRKGIAERWRTSRVKGDVTASCPIPWDVYDFGFTRQFAKPDDAYADWCFENEEG